VGIFADAPIRRKITSLMVLVSTLSILVLAGAIFFLEIQNQHRSLVDKVATLADIIVESSAEGMALNRSYLVTNVLNSLNRERHLRAAFVFREGKPFAQYLNPLKKTAVEGIPYFPCPLLERAVSTRDAESYFSTQHLGFVSPFYSDGKLVGHIYLQYGLDDLQKSLVQLSALFALIILFVVLLSVFVSSRLQGLISRPILQLVETMESVSSRQDFSVRVVEEHQDEIGSLIAGFNRMLGQLQMRDQELERHRRDLELLVEERTFELNCANRGLRDSVQELELAKNSAEQANQAKSQFLANMSHEIRTPMIGVLGMTELLFDTGLNEKQQHLAGTVFKSGEALLEIINDLLDFSRIEAGKMELSATDFNLAELVAEVLGLLQESAQNKQIDLRSQLAPELPVMVTGDSGRIRQILLNLAGNALKFSENGEVVVRLYPLTGSEPAMIRFEVEDSGVGITEEALETIFDTFTQGDDSTTRQHGGTGLGLAIVRQLAQLMGGDVSVRSRVGMGSCFRVDLPLVPTKVQPSALRQLKEFRALRALLVTDDEQLCLNLADQLIGLGFLCEQVNSGSRALQHLQSDPRHPVRLVLVDADMSGLGGLRLIEKIAELAPLVELKVILIAGQEHSALSVAESGARIDRWLYKPVRAEQIAQTMSELFSALSSVEPQAADLITPTGGKTVLLVEDNQTTQLFVRGILDQTDIRLQIACNGEQALNCLQDNRVDLIFMDCQMPIMDGFEATVRIRQLGHELPIIALTARVFEADVQRCRDAGMDDFLPKPFRQLDLFDKLEKWLDGRPS